MNLESLSCPHIILHVIVRPREMVDAALESKEGTPADRALMVAAFTLMHLYGDPDDHLAERIATIAPLFDLLLDQEPERAAEDVSTLWEYVVEAFEPGSVVREALVDAVSPRAREAYLAAVEAARLADAEPPHDTAHGATH